MQPIKEGNIDDTNLDSLTILAALLGACDLTMKLLGMLPRSRLESPPPAEHVPVGWHLDA